MEIQKLRIILFILIGILLGASFVYAETIHLKFGNTVEGKIIEKTDKYIKLDFQGVPVIYYKDEIVSIDGTEQISSSDDLKTPDNFDGEVHLNSGKIVKGKIIEQTEGYIKVEVNGVSVIYDRKEIMGIGKTVRNNDGSVSGSYTSVDERLSPDQEKSLNEGMAALGKEFEEATKSYMVNCPDFNDKLEKCEPYKCEFKHPFTGEMMEKQIVGEVNGKCLYTEQMPDGGKMECKYSENQRKAVAKFNKDIQSAMSSGDTVSSGTSGTKINGKDIKDPGQEAMDSGDCVISGYEQSSR